MAKVQELEERIAALEGVVEALAVVINKIMEDVYEPEFVQKIDMLARKQIEN